MFCRGWDCPKCGPRKIEEWQARIKREIPGPHVFVIEIKKTGRALTKWIQRHCKAQYYAVRKSPSREDGVLLVSRFKIKGAAELGKKGFLNGAFADLLQQPWHSSDRRILHRQLDNPPAKPYFYGFLCGHGKEKDTNENLKGYETAVAEGREAEWLFNHQSEIHLFTRGESAVREFHATVEREERLAIIEEGAPAW